MPGRLRQCAGDVQRNGDEFYEDLTPETVKEVLDLLAEDMNPKIGSQKGRKASMALSGTTTLKDLAKKVGVA
jgi:hypothetical protein